MKGTLPADLCLMGPMMMSCTTEGVVLNVDWRFVREWDLAVRGDRREYFLVFHLGDRTFTGRIMRSGWITDIMVSAEVKALRSLLPSTELAKALALSITRSAS